LSRIDGLKIDAYNAGNKAGIIVNREIDMEKRKTSLEIIFLFGLIIIK
jgi:hypothetical protein